VSADAAVELCIPADHPCFAGHFPGAPLLPGALLLDEILRRLPRAPGAVETPLQLSAVKFLRPVTPGARLLLRFERLPDGGVRFSAHAADALVADGVARQA
jgi:3-hydroxymyristoyl/3-hydroxydecanoyl-(acyl carrier protein) dehydratase